MKGWVLLLAVLLAVCLIENGAEGMASDNTLLSTPCINGMTLTVGAYRKAQESWKHVKWDDKARQRFAEMGITGDIRREHIILFVQKGFDTDRDGAINRTECENARNFYFTKFELQFGESCETVFHRCDCDGDGYITEDDFFNSKFSCLKDGNAGERMWLYVGSRMPTANAFDGLELPQKSVDYHGE